MERGYKQTYVGTGMMYKSLLVTYAIELPVGDHEAYAVVGGLVGGIRGCVRLVSISCT